MKITDEHEEAANSHPRWHGDTVYFGLHYDLHASDEDIDLGASANPEQLVPALRLMNPDFVQTDSKGVFGQTSWPSKTPGATVSKGVVEDALAGWAAAAKQVRIPLHVHYCAAWDIAAARKFTEWCAVDRDGQPIDGRQDSATDQPLALLSTRSPFVDELLIPQMIEQIERYGVDGFWIDADLAFLRTDYSQWMQQAFQKRTGKADLPHDPSDSDWDLWMDFQRDSYYEYVRKYVQAVQDAGALICVNWLQTFRNPGPVDIATDWISGDNTWVWGMDASRCEARFISTRGKHWDLMLWAFYKTGAHGDESAPWVAKPVQMLQQEAAVTLAFGGGIQLYEHPPNLRDGRLIPWRMARMGEVGRFVKARRELCQNTETIPQVAILHSEAHYYAGQEGPFPHYGQAARSVIGATYAMLENHYGVDILDEWALLPVLDRFPLVVAPERNRMSEEMVAALKQYVAQGGCLLLTGADAYERFGGDFLGVQTAEIVTDTTYHIPADDGAVPLYSPTWRHLVPESAEPFGRLGETPLLDDRLLPYPAAIINTVGEGRVAYVPAELFDFFGRVRYPPLRAFVGALAQALAGDLAYRVTAPRCVDVVLRRKSNQMIVHLVNRASGIPNQPNDATIDEIPPVGPISVEIAMADEPASVTLAFEDGDMSWSYGNDVLQVHISSLHIHAAVVIG